jgi:anti-sigma-K factor RskA
MYALDQSLAGGYHVADLRAQARRDAQARTVAPRPVRSFVRRFTR